MTTHSIGQIGQGAIRMVATKRPDIEVLKIKGVRMGKIRLAQIHLKTGEYLQVQLDQLGTHTHRLTEGLADAICGMRKAP